MKSCKTCKHYVFFDGRKYFSDPSAKWWICGWVPVRPYWITTPFSMNAVREETDGTKCETYDERAS